MPTTSSMKKMFSMKGIQYEVCFIQVSVHYTFIIINVIKWSVIQIFLEFIHFCLFLLRQLLYLP